MEYKFNDDRGEYGCEFDEAGIDTNGVKTKKSFWVSLEMAGVLEDFENLITKIRKFIEN